MTTENKEKVRTKTGRARLTELNDATVRKIRARYAKGDVTMEALGTENGLSAHQVSKVVRGQVRPDAGGPVREARPRLSAKDVANIRKRYQKGALQVELAREHQVSISVMSRLLRGLAHRDAGGPTFPEGAKRPRSRKLNAAQIKQILSTEESDSELARKFGCSRQLIQQFRKRWRGRVS